MTKFHKKNDSISWKWGIGKAQGKVDEIFHDTIEKTIKGSKIKKNGTDENPAYLIRQKNGNKVLKLHSELIKHNNSSDGSYSTDDNKHFVPNKDISNSAEHGLKLHEKFKKGGTDVGVKRAKQLINQDYLTIKDIKSIYSYFARHTIDKKSKDFGNEENPSKGYIAWLLWGGDDCEQWVKKIYDKIKGNS